MAMYGCVHKLALVFYGFLTCFTVIICARKVMLLDTAKFNLLDWTTKVNPADPPDSSNKGWTELSYIANGQSVQGYSSCYVISNDVDNWLRTPYLNVSDAKSLEIKMVFSMRKCSAHSDPERLKQCKETFNLYYYQADRNFANAEMPSWDSTSYTLIDKIAADQLFENRANAVFNTETRWIEMTQGLRGVYIAFQDTGACVMLAHVQIYYTTCDNVTINFAHFPETPIAMKEGNSVEVDGTCVENSDEVEKPKYWCTSIGNWSEFMMGSCRCRAGHEGSPQQTCTRCKPGYFKFSPGNSACSPCPAHSHTAADGSHQCPCFDTYFRAVNDPKTAPCTQPPSEPLDLEVVETTDTRATLQWNPPMDLGGRSDVTYRVECIDCSPGFYVSPRPSGFNTTSATISGLSPSTEYTIHVYSENGVSAESKKYFRASITVTTETSKPSIINLHTTTVGISHIAIAWELHKDSIMIVRRFEISHYPKGHSRNAVKNYTEQMNFTFKDLLHETEYKFQVRGETSKGWGAYSDPIYVKTGSGVSGKEMDDQASLPSVGIIIVAIIAVVLCMVIAVIMFVILLRRNRNHCSEKNPDCDTLHYSHEMEAKEIMHPTLDHGFNGNCQCTSRNPYQITSVLGENPYQNIIFSVTVPLFQPPGTIKSYVDPHTYEDPNQAVREFTREIDSSHITIESVIGGGEFGDVCKGKLRIPARPEMTVAIKTLKPGATDKNRLDFLTEASIMGQFDDPNVIFLEGVVTKSNPIMIVTEYMANGSLDTFLRKNDGNFTIIQLIGMMRGIASGMRYLSDMGYVHRDLAARNILVNERFVCKVADFGLSREVDIDTTDGAYTTKGGKIPVRWTAPEAIAFRKFTSASDVWSYGVVMWEIISYGERPYWNWSNQDVIKAVEKGYRLPPPMDCPEAIHQLMLDCWQKERNNRPKFTIIVKNLDKLIRAPELLRKMAKPRPQHFVDSPSPDHPNFSSVEEWLVAIKMERYIDNFVHAGYTSMEQMIHITVKDLDTLGITLLGHQKKIMNSIQTLRIQILGPQMPIPQMSEGFLV